MRNAPVAVVLALVAVFASGCGGGSEPSPSATDAATPASTTGATATASTAPGRTATPTPVGSADLACLVAGSPWHVSTRDLEGQIRGLMSRIDVQSVHIDGGQTITVDADLHATFTDDSTTTVVASLSDGMAMKLIQHHDGHVGGTLRDAGNKLVAGGPWDGAFHGSNKIYINGRASDTVPFQAPQGFDPSRYPMTYTCADGSLDLSVRGSPIVYLFRH